MSANRQLFIIGSGRCGTAALARLLGTFEGVEAHHEYCIGHTQPLSVLYHAGHLTTPQAAIKLRRLHGAAVEYSQAEVWADCSNKLSFLVKPLTQLFPDARFIWLTRDGRRVVSSFYHKLRDECYVPGLVATLAETLYNPYATLPPPEKRWWWPVPTDAEIRGQFMKWGQFQQVAWYWGEVNWAILKSFENQVELRNFDTASNQVLFAPIERMAHPETGPALLGSLLEFAGVDFKVTDTVSLWRQFLVRPHNVSKPVSYPLTREEQGLFWNTPGVASMMQRLGYEGEDYAVNYNPNWILGVEK